MAPTTPPTPAELRAALHILRRTVNPSTAAALHADMTSGDADWHVGIAVSDLVDATYRLHSALNDLDPATAAVLPPVDAEDPAEGLADAVSDLLDLHWELDEDDIDADLRDIARRVHDATGHEVMFPLTYE